MFVSAWTDIYLNYGNHTTNRVESQHSKLKLYLESTKSDLQTSLYYIHEVILSQDTAIKASFEQNKIIIKHRFNIPHFRLLCGFVSIHALDIIFNEFGRVQVVGGFSENCGCQLRTSYGLPCAHEQALYLCECRPIPLDSIDDFWRKLDVLPSVPAQDNDIHCEDELHMFEETFKKQSNSGRLSLLRRLKNIIAPSKTLVSEPAVHVTTRQERARHSSYSRFNYSHPFIDQFPTQFHSYINYVQNVQPDGNCGYRSIAICLGRNEENWDDIRKELMSELQGNRYRYLNMFSQIEYDRIYESLNFLERGVFAERRYWMGMPEMGCVIASRYNVILHVLSLAQCTTYLPLWSGPSFQQVAIAIGFVNGDHYVKVALTGEYPMPTIAPQWVYNRLPEASAWYTLYQDRFDMYNQYFHSNCTTENVILE